MTGSARVIAQQEIDALQEFLDDKRDSPERSKGVTDTQSAQLGFLEAELVERQEEEAGKSAADQTR